jgi:diaminohydroxyphosphoribosylaminopyrimidine deaminase/5-amino-6-(5-phosphoribosylamino)uracil reductase
MKNGPKELAKNLGGCPTMAFNAQSWSSVPEAFRQAEGALAAPWQELFGPIRRGLVDDLVVVGQFGQSIDARIATESGDSKYINGIDGLAHLHRLRALVDAVVVGVGTAVADDPQLTVRRVEGPHPARIVIDPKGRLPSRARLLAADGTRRLVITSEQAASSFPAGIEVVRLAAPDGHMAPADILRALAERGLRRILIEGGADTVSRFIAAGCLDRLHVVIAPIIIGAGPSSVRLAPVATMAEVRRAPMRAHILGDEVLLDCDLSAQRVAIGAANRST